MAIVGVRGYVSNSKTIEPEDFPRDFSPILYFVKKVIQCHDIVHWRLLMIKTLTKHGNSYALVIDKPILDLLKIRPDTPLTISTDGKKLLVSPEVEDDDIGDEQFQEILDKINRRYANVFKQLRNYDSNT